MFWQNANLTSPPNDYLIEQFLYSYLKKIKYYLIIMLAKYVWILDLLVFENSLYTGDIVTFFTISLSTDPKMNCCVERISGTLTDNENNLSLQLTSYKVYLILILCNCNFNSLLQQVCHHLPMNYRGPANSVKKSTDG